MKRLRTCSPMTSSFQVSFVSLLLITYKSLTWLSTIFLRFSITLKITDLFLNSRFKDSTRGLTQWSNFHFSCLTFIRHLSSMSTRGLLIFCILISFYSQRISFLMLFSIIKRISRWNMRSLHKAIIFILVVSMTTNLYDPANKIHSTCRFSALYVT